MLSDMDGMTQLPGDLRAAPQARDRFELEWPVAPVNWTLKGDVHIWSASLDQPEEIAEKLKATLSGDERSRAGRFRFDQERERYSVGRGLLRTLLSGCVGAAPASLVFCYGPQGKPSLAGRERNSLFFNLSHSGKMILIAVTRLGPIGVDVERVCWLSEAESIVDRFFSAEEKMTFQRTVNGSKLRTFFKIWTRKEAVLKCSGQGIAQIESSSSALEFNGFEQELAPASDYVGSVAVRVRVPVIHTWRWSSSTP